MAGSVKKGIGTKGRTLERMILKTAVEYERRGFLSLEKAYPPFVWVRGKIILQPSPYLDFVGTWIERDGRAIFIEAKETKGKRLPLGNVSNGLKIKQIAALKRWHFAGALVGVIWQAGSYGCVWLGWDEIGWAFRLGRRSLLATDYATIPQGEGWVLIDFREMMIFEPRYR